MDFSPRGYPQLILRSLIAFMRKSWFFDPRSNMVIGMFAVRVLLVFIQLERDSAALALMFVPSGFQKRRRQSPLSSFLKESSIAAAFGSNRLIIASRTAGCRASNVA